MWRSMYFAIGFLVARWIFNRQEETITAINFTARDRSFGAPIAMDEMDRLRAVGGM